MKDIALEIIAYQNNDPFPKKLTQRIELVYEEIENKVYKDIEDLIKNSKEVRAIEELIQDRFNMNIVFSEIFDHYRYHIGAVYTFFSAYLAGLKEIERIGAAKFSNTLKSSARPKNEIDQIRERKEILSKLHNRRGYIDYKNARVGGYLSEVKHYLIINFFYFRDVFKMTPAEISAVILHEIGHAFNGLEYHHKLESTNETIISILNEINNNNLDKALYIFKKNFTAQEFQDATVSNTKEIYDFYGKIALAYLNEIKTQLGNAKYDETSEENLADSFATRFNVGRELVSGLYKWDISYKFILSKTVYRISLILDILVHVLILALFGLPGIIIMSIIIGTLYSSNLTIMDYDFPTDRYNRIKNTIINNLKDINLPKDLARDLLSQVNFISEIIEKSVDSKDIKSYIADIMLSSNRNNNYYIKLQQSIENNLNNLLFVKAQQIRLS